MSSPSGSGGGGGLGRSAPIRTVGGRGTIGGGVPTSKNNNNTNINSNIGIPSLPGSTPPLVKSKLALTPGRVGPSSSKPPSSSNNAASKYQSYDPYHQQPPPPPPPVSAAQTVWTAGNALNTAYTA